MKKFLSMVMAAAMVVSLVPATAFAASGDVKATAKVVGSKNYTQDEIESSKVNKKVSGPEVQLTFTTADYAESSKTAVKYTLSLDNANFYKDGSAIASKPELSITLKGDKPDTVTIGESGPQKSFDSKVFASGEVVTVKSVKFTDNDEVEVVIDGKMERGAVLAFDLTSVMDKTTKGKQAKVTVESDDITISNGSDLTYASVESKGIKASVKDTVDVAPEEMVELKELKIEPAVGDNIGAIIKTDGKLKLKLSSGFEFAGKKTDLKFSVGNPTIDSFEDDEIVLNIGDVVRGADVLKITGLKVEATSAKAGAVATLKVYADGNDTVSVEVAKVVDSAVVMSVDKDADVPVIYSGVNVKNVGITSSSDHEALEVTVKETFPGAWDDAKDFTFKLPQGVYIASVQSPSADNMQVADVQKWFEGAYDKGDYEALTFKRRTWTETEPSSKNKAELKFTLVLVADPNFEGDVALTLTGDALKEQKVTVAKFVKPFTVEAKQNDLQIDYRNTKVPTDVVIKEAEAGLWDKNTTFALSLDKIDFDDDAKVTVDSKSGLKVKDVKTTKGAVTFKVDSKSDDKPAEVTISGLTLFMQRNLPAGAYDLDVFSPVMLGVDNGNRESVADQKGTIKDTGFLSQDILGTSTTKRVVADINDDFYSVKAKAGFVNIITAGREDTDSFTTKVVVPVGEKYLVSGENKVEIDVPAYINAGGYTMLPLRAVSVALGINSNNVLWDQSTRTATIMYGSKIISMTSGQKVVYVNAAPIPAATSVEIKDGRMFLGLRDLGNALGVTDITWDQATKTATLNGGK
ncbi:copper amine oxidase N-terminal domain-containing protein [Anaerotignum sp.]|uniref:copper amine oxidase N-terminal domain-containing protein n=1 Tax=Anaerotignum sp. TaxID=2039241 RepID=UPI0029D82F94|nr:copper amine oxidase N-terminal domain-containing protein [Anaerotignum sp.]MCI6056016.1 copper amine oxidase N-terminal domain-containing protein [Clostridia bacterium]MDY3596783.1 copper amine oxidase N-terminal domain-containing protein [Anaerotignum sp.]